jgi:hypothetical protein
LKSIDPKDAALQVIEETPKHYLNKYDRGSQSRWEIAGMNELLIRFLVGGIVVSSFALLGEIFRPKSFAGLFGAAPSIALATFGLTIARHGKVYASLEARSMIFGSVAFFFYASAASFLLMRYKAHALTTTITLIPVWLGVSFGLLFMFSK